MSRRLFLGTGAAGAMAVISGCGRDGGSSSSAATGIGSPGVVSPTTLSPADFDELGTCLLTAEQGEGPFYLSGDLVRSDITEGRDGHPLQVGIRVVDGSCEPLGTARVDIWHADVDGDYSGFIDGGPASNDEGEGSTFLRGTVPTNPDGIAEFATNYPGWYPGRTPHVHLKVALSANEVLTTQLYFPEDVTDSVYAAAPYSDRGERDTRNAEDGIAGGDLVGDGVLLSVRSHESTRGPGSLGLVLVGVDPA